jgi:hypothetical protein
VDELATRDKATAAIMEQPGKVAWLVLGADGADAFGEGTLGFYGSKNLLHKVKEPYFVPAGLNIQ